MQEPFVVDSEILGVIITSILTVVTTLVAVMSFNTSNRVSKIESEIKEAEFSWKIKARIRRELVAKLRITHILRIWIKSLEIIQEVPYHEDLETLTKQMKPLVDEYGEVVPEALALHNEIDIGLIAGEYTDQKDVLSLATRVENIAEKFQEEVADLTGLLACS